MLILQLAQLVSQLRVARGGRGDDDQLVGAEWPPAAGELLNGRAAAYLC